MGKSIDLVIEKAKELGLIVPFLNKSFVSIYKFFSFLLLALIVAGMVFYLCTSGFYFLNHHWIVPIILNPENDKVIQARLGYLEKYYQVENMRSELLQMQTEDIHYEFVLSLYNKFQKNFLKAFIAESNRHRKEEADYSKFTNDFKTLNKNEDFSENQQKMAEDLENQYTQNIISREDYLKGRATLSQLGISRILQKEKLVTFLHRKETLEKILSTLGNTSDGPSVLDRKDLLNFFDVSGGNIEILFKEQPLYAAVIAQSDIEAKKSLLKQKIQHLDSVIKEYQIALDKLKKSPYVRAADSIVTVAFVPYENLKSLDKDNKVYGCYLEFIFCRHVGNITNILAGEVTVRHPLSGKEMRGQMIELSLEKDHQEWAKSSSLVTRRPLFL